MSSISHKPTIDKLIANNGAGSPRVVEILEYENIFDGGTTWKLIYKGDRTDYIKNNLACRSWKSIWRAK